MASSHIYYNARKHGGAGLRRFLRAFTAAPRRQLAGFRCQSPRHDAVNIVWQLARPCPHTVSPGSCALLARLLQLILPLRLARTGQEEAARPCLSLKLVTTLVALGWIDTVRLTHGSILSDLAWTAIFYLATSWTCPVSTSPRGLH